MRVACWQAVADVDGHNHMRRLEVTARRARDAGAELLITPELSLTGYGSCFGNIHQAVDRFEDYAVHAAEIAVETGLALIYGGPERTERGVFNTIRSLDARGTMSAVYRKTQLYGPQERSVFTAGEKAVVQTRIGGLTVGLLICYDVEFPELVRAHALRGTDLLAVPTALARPWEIVPETLVPARAFENQIYVAYTNWAGSDAYLRYCGLSRVADPHGRVQSLPANGEHLLISDVEPAEIAAARVATPYLADRRPSLYADLVSERSATRRERNES